MFWIACLCQLNYGMCSKYSPSACTHALRRARHFVNGCVDDALLQFCAKRIAGAVVFVLTRCQMTSSALKDN